MTDLALAFLDKSRHLLLDDLRAIEGCLERMPQADVWWRPNDASNSIGHLLQHLNGSLTEWILGGIDRRAFVRDRPAEFLAASPPATSASLWHALQATVDAALGVLERLDAASLLERRIIRQHDVSVLEAIAHSVHHFGEHTGQIVSATKLRTGLDLGLSSLRSIAVPPGG